MMLNLLLGSDSPDYHVIMTVHVCMCARNILREKSQ